MYYAYASDVMIGNYGLNHNSVYAYIETNGLFKMCVLFILHICASTFTHHHQSKYIEKCEKQMKVTHM